MRTAVTKKEAEDDQILTIYNVIQWMERQEKNCGVSYGFLSNVFLTFVAYKVPQVVAEDYVPEDRTGLSEEMLLVLRVNAEKERLKIVEELKRSEPRMFAYLRTVISDESLDRIREHADWDACLQARSGSLLVVIIRDTHLIKVEEAGAQLKETRMYNLTMEWADIHQLRSERIAKFKKRFDALRKTCEDAGLDKATQPALAISFLNKLDKTRYSGLMFELLNGAQRGIEYPQTLAAMYKIASSRTRDPGSIQTGDQSSRDSQLIMLADELLETETEDTMVIEASTTEPKWKKPNRAKTAVKPSAKPEAKSGTPPESARIETRTCRHCNRKGHIQRDCPDNEERESATSSNLTMTVQQLLVTPNEDDLDGEDPTEWDFVIERSETVLFSDTEVLLDCQAGRGVFKNSELLCSVGQGRSIRINGINKDAAPLLVTESGDFEGICTVGFHKNAVANVASMAVMIDSGANVRYDNVNDRFTVMPPNGGRRLVFARKLLPTGMRSNHYACDMATLDILVETVSENMMRLTTREIAQAAKARRS
jgi:hypothetical protein